MDAAARGKKLLADKRYEDAIVEFTAALQTSPTSPDYLSSRSTAYQRLQKHSEALADAEAAVVNAQKRAKREKIVEAQFRRGVALFGLERYGDAGMVLGIVERLDPKNKLVAMWMSKVKQKLVQLGPNDEKGKVIAKETPEVKSRAEENHKAVTPVDSTSKLSPTTALEVSSVAPDRQPQQTPRDKIRHEWYQTNENVHFTLLVKGVPKESAQIEVQERSLNISFPIAGETQFDFTLDPLYAAVQSDQCSSRVLSTKIEVVLVKATPGQKWHELQSSEPVVISSNSAAGAPETETDSDTATTTTSTSHPASAPPHSIAAASARAPAYPTSSRSGPKDWDRITGTQTKDEDDEMDGGDEANSFFKKLFRDASPDVQRAMMKSFTESNGTALSTNWNEVSQGPVETVPPEGMEVKTWER